MGLIYDGILSRDEASSCEAMSKDYRYAIELSRLPERAVLDEALKQRKWTHVGENCMGQRTQNDRAGILYGLVHKNFLHGPRDEQGKFLGGTFLFVVDADDHGAAVAKLGDLVINASPFKTALEVRT
ncbi:hypothetical protein J0664_06200 [Rhizobium leguminosarum]|uniref:hypothetical protein n=1 Tax=Rhizobium leguminosarum TaxID=384 RepID=UPI001A91B3BC|nr:hypothetical protein [Rhizobium leguminosarum]MBY5553698.1 hypothetical protein [Rhizobium leguminosarum]QSW24887.1 hypothetical protein J0664_06200 [Rhizobium leguminosarum]